MMKIRKKPLIRYLHGARVTEGGIIHTKKGDRGEKTLKFPG